MKRSLRSVFIMVSGGGALAAAGVISAAIAGSSHTGPTVNDHFVTFTSATVVDPIVFGGEPHLTFDPTTNGVRSFVDWPVGSTQNIGVLFRSIDGGISYTKRYADASDPTTAGLACQQRQVPMCVAGGGGDTDVNVNASNGNVYFTSQEALANQAAGTSFDHGTTFPATHVDATIAKTTAVDRQWLASWKGTSTVFLAYHVPAAGIYVNRSDSAGQLGSWTVPPVPQIPNVTQSGSFIADNTGGIHNKALYVGYLNFPDLTGSGGQNALDGFTVAVSTDGAKTFTRHKLPGGKNARNFTTMSIDTVGNLYATWVDSQTQATYLSTSKADRGVNRTQPGTLWSTPVQVSASPVNVSIFSNTVAGSPGRIAIGYYGTTANVKTPDDVKPGAGGWYPFVSVSMNALCQWDRKPCTSPLFHQTKVSQRPNQDDNICTSGTACAATMGNRNLADFFSVSLDKSGHLGFVWSDGYNATKKPFVKVTRQATGPSLYAGMPDAHVRQRVNGVGDLAGDAKFPIAGAQINKAKNKPSLDLLGTTATIVGPNLRLTIKLASTELGKEFPTVSLDGLTVLRQVKWVTRWDYKGHSFYAVAQVPTGGGTVTYGAGEVSDTEGLRAAGSGIFYGNTYKPLTSATGHVAGKSLVIEVPLSSIGGLKKGARVFSLATYSMVGTLDALTTLDTVPIVVDSTPTFDAKL